MRQLLVFLCLPLLAGGLLAGCGGSSLASPPPLDCAAPFPELAAKPASDTAAPTGEPAEDGSGLLRVPLAGRLAAELPADGWRLFSDETLTMILHIADSNRPDVLIYAEALSGLAKTRPSEEARRFLLTVDPALLRHDWSWGSSPAAVAAGLPATSPADRRNLRTVTGMAMTRTGGRGLGYASDPGSFSGWKWIGQNPQGSFLRLARSHGRWGEQGLLEPALGDPLDRLVQKFPQTAWMESGARGQGESGDEGSRPTAPAYMIVGSARSSAGEVHLALLCALAPRCDAAPVLAGFLASLRPITGDELNPETPPLAPQDLALEPEGTELMIAPQSGVLPVSPAAAP